VVGCCFTCPAFVLPYATLLYLLRTVPIPAFPGVCCIQVLFSVATVPADACAANSLPPAGHLLWSHCGCRFLVVLPTGSNCLRADLRNLLYEPKFLPTITFHPVIHTALGTTHIAPITCYAHYVFRHYHHCSPVTHITFCRWFVARMPYHTVRTARAACRGTATLPTLPRTATTALLHYYRHHHAVNKTPHREQRACQTLPPHFHSRCLRCAATRVRTFPLPRHSMPRFAFRLCLPVCISACPHACPGATGEFPWTSSAFDFLLLSVGILHRTCVLSCLILLHDFTPLPSTLCLPRFAACCTSCIQLPTTGGCLGVPHFLPCTPSYLW